MWKCYLCGKGLRKNENKSKDHVPPDCIFPREKPQNLITVPCCIRCNEAFKLLDEKMRNFFAVLSGDKSGEVGKIAQHEILRSGRLSKDFLSYTKQHPSLVDDHGNPRLVFYFNNEELERWLIRVVKGLAFHRTRIRISDGAVYKMRVLSEFVPQPSNTFPMEKGLEFRPHFVYGVIQDGNADFWVLIFYDHLMFSIRVDMPT
jgi:hypothetical protein